MSADFDPYHRWLGIHPKHLPADHYRLLGIELLEADPEVIRDAAERQSGHVRRYALGQHGPLCQRILNEIGAAKACLLDPVKKAQYDATLKTSTAPATPFGAPVETPPPATAEPMEPVSQPVILPAPGSRSHRAVGARRVPRTAARRQRHIGETRSRMKRLTPVWLDKQLTAWAGEDRPWLLPVLRSLVMGGTAGLLAVILYVVFVQLTGVPANPHKGSMVAGPNSALQPRDPKPPPSPPSQPLGLEKVEDWTVDEGGELRIPIKADAGEPPHKLSFRLGPNSPEGAQIDKNTGEFTWTPEPSAAGQNWPITITVRDDGTPPLNAETRFTVRVEALPKPEPKPEPPPPATARTALPIPPPAEPVRPAVAVPMTLPPDAIPAKPEPAPEPEKPETPAPTPQRSGDELFAALTQFGVAIEFKFVGGEKKAPKQLVPITDEFRSMVRNTLEQIVSVKTVGLRVVDDTSQAVMDVVITPRVDGGAVVFDASAKLKCQTGQDWIELWSKPDAELVRFMFQTKMSPAQAMQIKRAWPEKIRDYFQDFRAQRMKLLKGEAG